MAKELNINDVIERARRAQETRIDAIRVLAEARQSVAEVHDKASRDLAELQARIAQQVGDAEREDVKAYNAAVGTGWTPEELRKIGFAEPDKKARTRRRAALKSDDQPTAPDPQSEHASVSLEQHDHASADRQFADA